jgi:hypothetical protein
MKNGVKEGDWKSSKNNETIGKEKFARGFTVIKNEKPKEYTE